VNPSRNQLAQTVLLPPYITFRGAVGLDHRHLSNVFIDIIIINIHLLYSCEICQETRPNRLHLFRLERRRLREMQSRSL